MTEHLTLINIISVLKWCHIKCNHMQDESQNRCTLGLQMGTEQVLLVVRFVALQVEPVYYRPVPYGYRPLSQVIKQ